MIAYGRNCVTEGLKSSCKSVRVLVESSANSSDSRIQEILALAQSKNIKVERKSNKELTTLTKGREHQGVALEIIIETQNLKQALETTTLNANHQYIYISEATYEHNVGAIIRSAECAGFSGVILPKDIKITPTIAKISTGAVFHMHIFHESIFVSIKYFQESGFQIVGIEREGENCFNLNLKKPTLYIIGGEDKSLSRQVRSHCNYIAEIPQRGKINSLNMSVAAGIVMFESLRQSL